MLPNAAQNAEKSERNEGRDQVQHTLTPVPSSSRISAAAYDPMLDIRSFSFSSSSAAEEHREQLRFTHRLGEAEHVLLSSSFIQCQLMMLFQLLLNCF